MNYISILSFAVLLLAVTSAQTFNGTRVHINEQGAISMADKHAGQLRDKVGHIVFGNITVKKKISLLDFDVTIENIKSNITLAELKGDSSFNRGNHTITYNKLFYLNISFKMRAKVQNVVVADDTGKIFISGEQLDLAIDYIQEKPIGKAKFETKVTLVEFNGGLFTDSLISIVKEQFEKKISSELNRIEEEFGENDPLSTLETPEISVGDENKISISRERLNKNIEVNLTRLMDPKITCNEREKILDRNCTTNKENNVTNICYCPHMFLEMLIIAGVEKDINLTNWTLQGKVIELYEILPSLINYYSPDADYEVTSKIIEPKSNSAKAYELTKLYVFKIGSDTVLSITTRFKITIIGKVENKKLSIMYNSTSILSITTDEIIQPSGRTVLARLMLAEVTITKNESMFSQGIPIDAEDTEIVADDTIDGTGTTTTKLCIDLLTKP